MKVTFKTLAKDVLSYDVSVDTRVEALKSMVAKDKDVPLEQLTLVYSGLVLTDDAKTLQELDYQESHYIVMMIRKPKAKPAETTPSPVAPANNSPVPTPAPLVVEEETDSEDGAGRNVYNLSQIQIQQLYQVLNNDPTITALLTANPHLREQLTNPTVLIEILSRMGHPVMNQLISSEEESTKVVQVTKAEGDDLNLIKTRVKDIVGNVAHITDGQLNAVIYQAYTLSNKDCDMATTFLVNEILEGNI